MISVLEIVTPLTDQGHLSLIIITHIVTRIWLNRWSLFHYIENSAFFPTQYTSYDSQNKQPLCPLSSRDSSVGIATFYFPYLFTCWAEPFLRSCKSSSHSGNSQHFMEPEGSSPCSQNPSTGPYPEPNRSSPYHPILSLKIVSKIHFNIVHPPTSCPS
jgi:hypothetical protein